MYSATNRRKNRRSSSSRTRTRTRKMVGGGSGALTAGALAALLAVGGFCLLAAGGAGGREVYSSYFEQHEKELEETRRAQQAQSRREYDARVAAKALEEAEEKKKEEEEEKRSAIEDEEHRNRMKEIRRIRQLEKQEQDRRNAASASNIVELEAAHNASIQRSHDEYKARQLEEEQTAKQKQEENEARRKQDEYFDHACEEYRQRKMTEDLKTNSQNIHDYLPASYDQVKNGYVYYFNVAPDKSVTSPMMTGPYICALSIPGIDYYSTFDRLYGEKNGLQRTSGQTKLHKNDHEFPIYVLSSQNNGLPQDVVKNREEYYVSRHGEEWREVAEYADRVVEERVRSLNEA